MRPWRLVDQHAAGEEQMGLEPDLLADVQRRARLGRFIGRRLIDQKPQPSQALQAGDVARLGQVRYSHAILGESFDAMHVRSLPARTQHSR